MPRDRANPQKIAAVLIHIDMICRAGHEHFFAGVRNRQVRRGPEICRSAQNVGIKAGLVFGVSANATRASCAQIPDGP